MRAADFGSDPEGARSAINRWVSEQTRDRIRDLLSPRVVDDRTRLVLVNAIHFAGRWERPFFAQDTHDEPFHLIDGETVRAPLMRRVLTVAYLEQSDGVQAVELPYEGDRLSMLVLLPARRDGLAALEKKLSAEMLRDCARAMRTREVRIVLPRFQIAGDTVDLRDALRKLGMVRALDRERADFSGINGRVPPDAEALSISAVLHKSFVELDEQGTRAAAAAAVAIMTLGGPRNPPPIPDFRADHPFLFAIRDRREGAILFLGRVADPR
jgi:serpin B